MALTTGVSRALWVMGGFHVVRGNEQGGNACRVIPFHGADEQGLEFVVRFPLYGFHTEPLDVLQGGFDGGHGVLVGEAEDFLLGFR